MGFSHGLPDVDEDVVTGSVTPMLNDLYNHEHLDLTSLVDPVACSSFPRTGGGFADVYRGALQGGKEIAIKTLRIYGETEETLNKRAAREIACWAKLKHKNVLPLLGLAHFQGHISLVSEWMDNGDLMTYLNRKPGADRLDLVIQISEGLQYIHDKQLVHGDLKAGNVMVASDGTVKLSDFGNAVMKDITMEFTHTSARGSTMRWMAPELLCNDDGPRVSKEADVYAYGMTVLETLTGQLPFEGATDNQIYRAVVIEHGIPHRPHGVHNDVWEIMKACWIQDPSKRANIPVINRRLRTLSLGEYRRHSGSPSESLVEPPDLVQIPKITRHTRYGRALEPCSHFTALIWRFYNLLEYVTFSSNPILRTVTDISNCLAHQIYSVLDPFLKPATLFKIGGPIYQRHAHSNTLAIEPLEVPLSSGGFKPQLHPAELFNELWVAQGGRKTDGTNLRNPVLISDHDHRSTKGGRGTQDYKCTVCGQSFFTKSNMHGHIGKSHPSSRSYVQCGWADDEWVDIEVDEC